MIGVAQVAVVVASATLVVLDRPTFFYGFLAGLAIGLGPGNLREFLRGNWLVHPRPPAWLDLRSIAMNPLSSKVTAVAVTGAIAAVLRLLFAAVGWDLPVPEEALLAIVTAVMTAIAYFKDENRPAPSAVETIRDRAPAEVQASIT